MVKFATGKPPGEGTVEEGELYVEKDGSPSAVTKLWLVKAKGASVELVDVTGALPAKVVGTEQINPTLLDPEDPSFPALRSAKLLGGIGEIWRTRHSVVGVLEAAKTSTLYWLLDGAKAESTPLSAGESWSRARLLNWVPKDESVAGYGLVPKCRLKVTAAVGKEPVAGLLVVSLRTPSVSGNQFLLGSTAVTGTKAEAELKEANKIVTFESSDFELAAGTYAVGATVGSEAKLLWVQASVVVRNVYEP
jgi:hypothetical protein